MSIRRPAGGADKAITMPLKGRPGNADEAIYKLIRTRPSIADEAISKSLRRSPSIADGAINKSLRRRPSIADEAINNSIRGRPGNADEAINKSLRRSPSIADEAINKSLRGRPSNADKAINKSLRRRPSNADEAINKSLRRHTSIADEAINKSLRGRPSIADEAINNSIRGRPSNADEAINKSLRRRPSNADEAINKSLRGCPSIADEAINNSLRGRPSSADEAMNKPLRRCPSIVGKAINEPLRTHDCYEHYKLKSCGKLFTCDGCKTKGFGERFQCELCGQELHRECRYPQTTISHEFLGCSTLNFRDKPLTRYGKNNRKEYSKCCNACGKDICGFSYHCKEDNLDLHPTCRKLNSKLVIDDTVFDLLPEKVSPKCIWCKNREISHGTRDGPGWSYLSTCKKYHFHVYCMKEMVYEVCMKNGEMGLEKVQLRHGRPSGSSSTLVGMITSFLQIVLSALFGDPTFLVSRVLVELVSHALQ